MGRKRKLSLWKVLTGGIIVFLVAVAIILPLHEANSEKATQKEIDGLKVTYSNGEDIAFDNFGGKFENKRTILLENTTDKYLLYSIEWSEVKNTLVNQTDFLYEISCEGDKCATLGKSQVPVADAVIFPQAVIKAGETQKYTILLSFNGSETGVMFGGKLIVNPLKIEENIESDTGEENREV